MIDRKMESDITYGNYVKNVWIRCSCVKPKWFVHMIYSYLLGVECIIFGSIWLGLLNVWWDMYYLKRKWVEIAIIKRTKD